MENKTGHVYCYQVLIATPLSQFLQSYLDSMFPNSQKFLHGLVETAGVQVIAIFDRQGGHVKNQADTRLAGLYYPRKRTFAAAVEMSAKCQKQTYQLCPVVS
jgi:hypothetical protein